MPTGLPRIQVLCQPDTFAQCLTLVNVTGKTKSNIAHELIQHALKDEKYKALLAEADEAQTVKPIEDPRTESRKKSFHRQPSAKVKTSYKQYLETSAPKGLVSDGKGGLIDPSLSEDDKIHMDLQKAQMARPVFTAEEHTKLMEMVSAGVITNEKALEMMSYQTPAEGQDKEEKQAHMRQELLKTIGEQDQRIKNMEGMMAQLLEVVSLRTPS